MTEILHLTRLRGSYAVARGAPDAAVPARLLAPAAFVSISRTVDELSVVAVEAALKACEPHALSRVEPGWTAFRVQGPLDFGQIGILAGLSDALAQAGLGIFAVSTFDTDYVLVKAENADAAADAWRGQGHTVEVD